MLPYLRKRATRAMPVRVAIAKGPVMTTGSSTPSDLTTLERQLLGDAWTSNAGWDNLVEFCDVIGNRWAASDSEHQGGEWLKARLESYGLQNVRLEPVEFGGWTRGAATLEMTSPIQQSFSVIALPYCPAVDLEAEMIDVGNGEQEDFERLGEAVRGKIAITAAETNPLNARSEKLSHRTDKLRFAEDAGAIALVYINQNPGMLHISGAIAEPGGKPARIAGLGTSWEHGSTLLRLAKRHGGSGPVRLKIHTGGTFHDNTSYNVVADIVGSEHPDEVIVTGGHYDGHDISQAAMDDGAGTMVTLEAARVLAALPAGSVKRTIRFVCFCGEEVGLFGSWGYTADHEDEIAKTRFMLNLDGAGQGRGGSEQLTLTLAPDLVEYFQGQVEDMHYDMPVQHKVSPHSDHYPWAIRGVPTATLGSKDTNPALVGRGWGHTEADTVDKGHPRGLQMSAAVVARLLLRIANDDSFPGYRRSRENIMTMITDLGLDEPLRRAGRLDLVGGQA
jgi:Iap family predicted aminopeptidase